MPGFSRFKKSELQNRKLLNRELQGLPVVYHIKMYFSRKKRHKCVRTYCCYTSTYCVVRGQKIGSNASISLLTGTTTFLVCLNLDKIKVHRNYEVGLSFMC